MENRQLIKFIRSYIRDSSGVFFISSLVRISMTSFSALKLMFVRKYSCLYDKKKITRRLLVVKKNIFDSLASLFRKVLFLPLENKIQIFAPPCNILYVFLGELQLYIGLGHNHQRLFFNLFVLKRSKLKHTKLGTPIVSG